MKKLAGTFRAFVKDEDGATMVEYGLMVALIAVVAGVGAQLLGLQVLAAFNSVTNSITAAL